MLVVCAVLMAGRVAAAECSGAYAEDLSALSPKAREAERHVTSYVYAIRTTATYECVAYSETGDLHRTRSTQVAHGTAFGYRRDGKDTLLLTNEHVAEWPLLSNGCKRISESLRIVDDDKDDYAADDIILTQVVVDPALDIAVLRAHQQLPVLPWKIGTSATLTPRQAVEVRGFPLGEFQALNVGKVVSTHEHDDQGDWDHDDFVIDALLTSGGSGSPVLAISCKTGEPELVGIFHAHYNAASALNVVVGIDQVRDLMTTLQRSPRPTEPAIALDGPARTHLVEAIHVAADPPFFPFGPLVASVTARGDGTLVYAVYPSDFPHTTRPLVVLEDAGADGGFGKLAHAYIGLHPYDGTDADTQALLSRTLDALRRDAIASLALRSAPTPTSRDSYHQAAHRRRSYDRMIDGQRDLAEALDDLAGKVHLDGPAVTLDQLLH